MAKKRRAEKEEDLGRLRGGPLDYGLTHSLVIPEMPTKLKL